MRANAWHIMCVTTLLAASTAGICEPTKTADSSGTASTISTTANPTQAHKEILWVITQKPVHHMVAPGVPNFGEENAHLWRSGQPTTLGYKTLAAMHVKTIVNLRKEFPGDKDLLPPGIQYFQIPITDETAPTEEQARQFLQIVTNPANWPVLVHCHGGQGRAGLMCALARYSIDGWDNRRIMSEVSNFHVAYLGMFKMHMCSAQQNFLRNWEKENQPGAYISMIDSNPTDAKQAQASQTDSRQVASQQPTQH